MKVTPFQKSSAVMIGTKVRAAAVFAIFSYSALAFGQKPEYEFYYKFRADFAPTLQEENHWTLTDDQIFEKYAARLRSEGVAEPEIARRFKLLHTEHNALKADYSNRYYRDPNANFNHAPNAFLMETVKGSKPGVALDYGMGQGRNAIYLASWDGTSGGSIPLKGGSPSPKSERKSLV